VTNHHEISIYVADDFVTHDWTNAFNDAIDDACACGTDGTIRKKRCVAA